MMAWLSASSVCGPKFIVPRTRRLTLSPVRPSCVYSMTPHPTSGSVLHARGPGPGEAVGRHRQSGHGAGQVDVVAEVRCHVLVAPVDLDPESFGDGHPLQPPGALVQTLGGDVGHGDP